MRGNATFETMKGFEDLTTKGFDGGPDALPGKMKGDVTDKADIDSADRGKSGVNAKRSDNTASGRGLTMRPDAKDIEDKADSDIESGYVSDVQHLPGPGTRAKKGFEQFNDLVSKGIVVDTAFDKFDVDNSMAMIEKEADFQLSMTTDAPSSWMQQDFVGKSLDDEMVVSKGVSFEEFEEKGPTWEAAKTTAREGYGLAKRKLGAAYGATKEHVKRNKHKYGYGATAAAGLGVGYAAGSQKKGFDAYNSGLATKGFTVEEKGPTWEAAKTTAREAKALIGRKARAGYEATKEHVKRNKHKYGYGATAVGAAGAGYGAAKYRENKTLDSSMVVTKTILDAAGNAIKSEAPGVLARTADAIGRFGKRQKERVVAGYGAAKEHVKEHPHAYGYGAVGAGALGAGYVAGSKKKELDSSLMTVKASKKVVQSVVEAPSKLVRAAQWAERTAHRGKEAVGRGYRATKQHIKEHPHHYAYPTVAAGGVAAGYGASKLQKRNQD